MQTSTLLSYLRQKSAFRHCIVGEKKTFRQNNIKTSQSLMTNWIYICAEKLCFSQKHYTFSDSSIFLVTFVFFKGKLLEKVYSVEKNASLYMCESSKSSYERCERENKQSRQVHCCFNYSFSGLTFHNGTGSEVDCVCVGRRVRKSLLSR